MSDRWPTLGFFRRLVIFYATIWVGVGAIAVVLICLWFRPVATFVVLQEVVGSFVAYRMWRGFWVRAGRPPILTFLLIVGRTYRKGFARMGARFTAWFGGLHERLDAGSTRSLRMPFEH